MIEKGVISTVSADKKTVTAVPSFSDSPVTSDLAVPFFLLDALEIGMPVVYAQFPDNTGAVLCRLDGEWNHDLDGDVNIKGILTAGDVSTEPSGSYNEHVQAYKEHSHKESSGGQTGTPV